MTYTNRPRQSAAHSPGPTHIEPAATYTPEPWWIDDDGFIAAGSGDDYSTVADPRCRPTADYGTENEANARRIAAAVIACEGISTEALEQGAVSELREALDYLLEQTVDQDLKYGIGLSEGEVDARAKALAAIAKAAAAPARRGPA